MADLAGDFEFLVASVRRSSTRLKESVRLGRGSSKRGKILEDHVLETLDAIEGRVTQSDARFNASRVEVVQRTIIESMRLLNRITSAMEEAVGWIRAAADPYLHIGLLYFVDEAANAMLGAEAEVVTAGDAKYRYATVSWPFRMFLGQLGKSPASQTRPIVLFYPPQETSSVLLHTLFAHELAHPTIDEYNLVDAVLANHRGAPAFDAEFDAAVGDLVKETGAPEPAARITMTTRLEDWTTELLCDALAIGYTGPTFLFAFGAVVLSTSWNEPNETHPPTTTRVELMLEQLKIAGWSNLLSAQVPKTLSWYTEGAREAVPVPRKHQQFLVDMAKRMAPDVRAAADGRLGGNSYKPGDYTPISAEIMGLLQSRVLPAQLQDGGATERRAILLSGWLYVFAEMGDAPKSLSDAAANDEFQEFLATALEMSIVLETWKAV